MEEKIAKQMCSTKSLKKFRKKKDVDAKSNDQQRNARGQMKRRR